MNAPVPKKKAPVRSLIRYAEQKLKPQDPHGITHPALYNKPDKDIILPGQLKTISTGLEVAIPPECIAFAVSMKHGIMITNMINAGYKKDLTLDIWNYTQSVIELIPFERIADLYLTEVKRW